MKGCATSHRLKWGPFYPNKVGMIAQHVRRKGRGKGWGSSSEKEGKEGSGIESSK